MGLLWAESSAVSAHPMDSICPTRISSGFPSSLGGGPIVAARRHRRTKARLTGGRDALPRKRRCEHARWGPARGRRTTLLLAGEFDASCVLRFERLVRDATEDPMAAGRRHADVTFVDSTGLALLLRTEAASRQDGFELQSCGPRRPQYEAPSRPRDSSACCRSWTGILTPAPRDERASSQGSGARAFVPTEQCRKRRGAPRPARLSDADPSLAQPPLVLALAFGSA